MRQYTLKTKRRAGKFVVDYSSELNPEQLDAVMAKGGPILVIAGAGSGKTRTVTYRVTRLIESRVDPSRILLVTFTNKAAKEMLHRVELLIGTDVKKLWGGTFHHIGNLILRHHADMIGFNRNYSILDREDSKDLLEACTTDLQIDTKSKRFPKGAVLLDIISFSINTETSIDKTINLKYPFYYELSKDIKNVARQYVKRKKGLNVMDYDALLLNWKLLFEERKDIREKYSNKFLHILIDEYQDTNKLQADIIDLTASHHRNLMVVGDDSQSIYSFRGANFANIIDFPKRYPDTTIYKLETNYRSTDEVLNMANTVLIHNIKQFPKKLRAVRGSGVKPGLIPLSDVLQQAEFIAERLLESRDEGIALNSIAILYRAHYQSMELQLELTKRGIPYTIRSGLRFFEQAHIKDITSYLKVVVNPLDEIAWKRILKLLPKIGNITADRIWKHIREHNGSLSCLETGKIQTLLNKGAITGWSDFVESIKNLNQPGIKSSPAEMIQTVLSDGYEYYLHAKYPDYVERIEDIKQIGNYASQYKSTESFLSELALLGTVESETVIFGGEEDEKVILSTVHQAKGLEWDVVFIIWLADGYFPSARSLKSLEGEEEERRLFYVAVTRARDELYLCYPIMNQKSHLESYVMKPSRFVKELEENCYERWEVLQE
ncbi:MAG: ATP-dependent DNA helicase PcrA [Candidatus Scalindua rubra]|uniref:DNA 3'-5' helicase n=1 Tax=Candidatus Scalindua rubra TaxID=1872076 RepID=A0A1E3XD86_9BACT|nr:MAG: ATP-dependent DNA helicase PcrA [Candidatus Scalindua rubra]